MNVNLKQNAENLDAYTYFFFAIIFEKDHFECYYFVFYHFFYLKDPCIKTTKKSIYTTYYLTTLLSLCTK